MTCVDLGANVGEYTAKMAFMAKQVIAFEPEPWAYAALQANVADLDNVRIENVAAGVNEGKAIPWFVTPGSRKTSAHDSLIQLGCCRQDQCGGNRRRRGSSS